MTSGVLKQTSFLKKNNILIVNLIFSLKQNMIT